MLVAFAFFFSQADGVSSNSDLSLWLKAEGYSVESINTITTVFAFCDHRGLDCLWCAFGRLQYQG